MIFPSALPPGGTIGICAPSGPVKPELLEKAISALYAAGYKVQTAPSAFSQHGFLAAPDDVRKRELEEMFCRPDIDAVFCARGGVGASRLLEILDTSRIVAGRKPFLGFSDVTALQWLLFARHQFVSFQGPLAIEWNGSVSEHSQKLAFEVLSGRLRGDLFSGFPREKIRVLRGTGNVSGPLMPGNLTMICSLLGTPYLPDLKGTILLIEDVNEPLFRVDRMLFHLRNAGVLDHLAGLLAGELCASPAESESVQTSLLEATRGTTYPIVSGLPFGHGPERMTLPVGAPVSFDIGAMTLTPGGGMSRLRIAFLVSGTGTLFETITMRCRSGILDAEPVLVISSRADAPALEKARRLEVHALVLKQKDFPSEHAFAEAMLQALRSREVNFVCLAGYLKLVPSTVVEAYRNRMLNIHPALLPAFGGPGMYGRRVHEAVIEYGARVSGATVHLVDDHYDHGPIVLQRAVFVRLGDTADSLAERVHSIEHDLYTDALRLFAQDRVEIQGRRINILPEKRI